MQGAKKIIFIACHPGKLKLAFTCPDIISTSPKSFFMRRIYFTVLLLFKLADMSVNQIMRMDDLNEKMSELSKQIPTGRPDKTGGG